MSAGMEEEAVYQMVCGMLRERWGAAAKPQLSIIKPAPIEQSATGEALVCQAKALIRELWPDEFDTKPKLRLIQGGLSV